MCFDFKKEPYIWQILFKLWLIGNRSSCRPIRSVIILVIKQIGRPRFVNHSYDYRPNWTPLSPVTVTNRTFFALYRIISVLNTKWDAKAFFFRLFNKPASWSMKYWYWRLNSAIWLYAYDFRTNCVPNCAPLSSIAIDFNLPMKFRICYTIGVIFFKAIHNLGPMYLSNLININDVLAVTCWVMWALFCMTLPLSSNALLGDRSLTAAAPKIWNVLPEYIRKENDFAKFKRLNKTYFHFHPASRKSIMSNKS